MNFLGVWVFFFVLAVKRGTTGLGFFVNGFGTEFFLFPSARSNIIGLPFVFSPPKTFIDFFAKLDVGVEAFRFSGGLNVNVFGGGAFPNGESEVVFGGGGAFPNLNPPGGEEVLFWPKLNPPGEEVLFLGSKSNSEGAFFFGGKGWNPPEEFPCLFFLGKGLKEPELDATSSSSISSSGALICAGRIPSPQE